VDALLRTVGDRVIVLADAEGSITQVNRATEKLLGYRSEELVGRSTTRLSDAGDIAEVASELGVPQGVDPLLELARWGLPNRQDWDYLTKDGRRRPVSLTVTAIGHRETPHGFVCVASDRAVEWQQVPPRRPSGERLLLDLDDAATRVLRWGVGRSRAGG
jgi:PAS domain S-box-containing protein